MTSQSQDLFSGMENLLPGHGVALSEFVGSLPFNEAGLLPAITQDVESGEVLMLAWMNREALEKTIASGRMNYWSRSRKSLWVKGETSGHFQVVVSVSFDCDGDAILCQVNQIGNACHTNRKSCFYLGLDPSLDRVSVIAARSN